MPSTDALSPWVVKVGGSLFDWPELGPRLRQWLAAQPTRAIVLVPGGGPTADVIRQLDERHRLGEERSHWLALRAMALNARFLLELLPNGVVVEHLKDCAANWRENAFPILDAHAFCLDDGGQPGCLPACWAVTSDSVAARAAVVAGARRLVLLKSADLPARTSWKRAQDLGFVDVHFGKAMGDQLDVQVVNLRSWPP